VVGINVRPGHHSEKEYYAAPELELVRTYPVYAPGREPAGYWQMVQNAKPERLLTPGARTAGEWIAEGKRVFHELDAWIFRSYDPKLIEIFRSSDEFQKRGGHALKTARLPVCAGCRPRKGSLSPFWIVAAVIVTSCRMEAYWMALP
jgi:hypothetical protein